MKKKIIIISSTLLVLVLGGVSALNVTNPSWRENTIFATIKDKQLAWLKEHEKEIVFSLQLGLVTLSAETPPRTNTKSVLPMIIIFFFISVLPFLCYS